MQNTRLNEAQAEIKIAGRNINNLRCRWHHPYGRKQMGTKESVGENERGEWKSWLKTQQSKTKDNNKKKFKNKHTHTKNQRSWHPVPSFHGKYMGKQWKQWETLFSWASKSLWMVTAVMKLKILAPWKKSSDKPLECIKRQRQYFANKGLYSQSYGFPVVIYWCESWTMKKTEHERIDALNCGVGEDSWESPGLQEDQTSQS